MTSEEKLPARCVEALYITTLLEDGFGFRGTHRGITLALEVDGTEVEWTLGFALAEECLESGSVVPSESQHSAQVDSTLVNQEMKEETTAFGSEDSSSTVTEEKEEMKGQDAETMTESEGKQETESGADADTGADAGAGEGKISRQIKSLLQFSKVSFGKISHLFLHVLQIISLRLQFTAHLLVVQPMKILSQQLTSFFVQFRDALHQAVELVRHRLPPSLLQRMAPRWIRNSTNPSVPPSSPPS
jgi:hypothetical protein